MLANFKAVAGITDGLVGTGGLAVVDATDAVGMVGCVAAGAGGKEVFIDWNADTSAEFVCSSSAIAAKNSSAPPQL